ncbi:C-terminal binding protein [Opitutus sp. GAS368]|uniref:C-terminal binding protein n=1 Tax=Opitutus sp. GAS368 TaxID=1882749 RepID=UPI00087B0D7A|nr:C-terminal binding protein [Opitutus sp. GAS368]SDR85515.1 D-3-phosphoglycerate dehydrogenase [Opitutus sp. GAS368]
MNQFHTVITDHGFPHLRAEESVLAAAGSALTAAQCKTPEEVVVAAREADALLVQWAPINATVIAALTRCKVIVRYGIGYDNVDLAAAKARGIPVCNVPDYGVNEVAEHAVSLALALARQLPQTDARLRTGTWKITPDRPMPALGASVFATAGFGRIARHAHAIMRGFGGRRIAYDPFVPAETMARDGVEKIGLEALFTEADLLSLHLPLTAETRHFVSAARFAIMKRTAVVVNTARGPLIDTAALAAALTAGTIAGAGLDVFETEPLPADHPLRAAPNALLTSHVAWYSESSIPRLQRLAAKEAARGLRGERLKNQVNR